jgi:FdhD protein
MRRGIAGADGFVVLTSRVSVEMVQKAAVLGTCAIVAVSAPTALAIRVAEQAGITLVAGAHGDVFDTFSGAFRIVP